MSSSSAQIEDIWDSIEQIYPKVQLKIPNFITIDKTESAFFDYFTDFSFVEDTKKIYNKYRDNRKTVWFPLINLVKHKHVSFVDLQEIQEFYVNLFEIPIDLNIRNIKNELYTIGITMPLRKFDVEIDTITARMINELKEKYPHPEGIFTLRLGTLKMVKKSNDRYFVDTPQTKLDDKREDEITKAVFNQLRPILANSTFMSPDEVLKKWHIAYSWGFPYRFVDGNENTFRRKMIHKMGGRQVFLKKIKQYLEGEVAIPSVSHVFLKDEVLKLSKVQIEKKIRSIIAMDPLTYFNGILVNSHQNKNFDPMNGCAIGMSSAYAIPPLIFEQHRSYKVHLQMDITAMDLTMSYNYMRMLMKIRMMGYENHPQRDRVEMMMKTYYDNLYNSYLWTLYDGEVKIKHRGHSTGQSTVNPDNTIYCLTLFVEAWRELTGMPANDFFKFNKITTYGDNNVLSSNCFNDKWNENTLCEYFAKKGVSLRLENKSEGLEGVEFLSKIYSDSEKQLEEVLKYVSDYECKTEVPLTAEEATPAEVTTEFETHSSTNDLTLL
ncbi:13874_t:CDS:2, partial [Dentiscutata erythropus]